MKKLLKFFIFVVFSLPSWLFADCVMTYKISNTDLPQTITACERYNRIGIDRYVKMLTIQANNSNITTIVSFRGCENLEYLSLSGNYISNISMFDNLTSLRYLDLARNIVEDVTPIVNLSNLEYLDLAWNKVTDTVWFENLTNLRYLYLTGNLIESVSALRNLKLLEYLDLSYNPLSSIESDIFDDKLNLKDILVGTTYKNLIICVDEPSKFDNTVVERIGSVAFKRCN